MSLWNKYNTEGVLIRGVLSGLLDILNSMKYTQIWGDSNEEEITLYWTYNSSGDERFNHDFYTFYGSCMPPRPIDGNFDVLPRGVITYTGSSISSQRITSRYVQGRYIKEVEGQLESYVSYLYSIPLNVKIDCELWCDRQITALKIEQQIRETFYKTVTFYSYYKGMRIGSTVGFPDDITLEKSIQYSFESDNKIKVTFQLEIETYQPVFDPTTETKANSKIKGFNYNLYPGNEKESKNVITVTSPSEGAIIPKGIPIWIEWIANDRGIIINNVDIQWCYSGQNDFYDIELQVPNHEYYIWNISNKFTDFKDPIIIWEEDSSISISRKPIVKIVPDLNNQRITNNSFIVIDEGYFICQSNDTSINIQLEIKDSSGNITYTSDGSIWANVKYNVLDTTNPFIVNGIIAYPEEIAYKEIDVHIKSGNNKTDIIGILNNVKIV